ncbi:hypothetical protein EXU30_08720 [Shewanella maritima]|uniref:Uncharacterized protein n=1 Tax=Shewanella maritima TaxID=2520507 RepID=A0A411PHA5_9GAMM|nr:hypothetical protein [Shewanella maritima]QBF82762.1 hypothetical protein EXU30_08720 [Shewanella maritima]
MNKIEKWEVDSRLTENSAVYVIAIHDDLEGFRVLLSGKDLPAFRLTVSKGSLKAYRVYDEVSLVGLSYEGSFTPPNCFYIVDSSEFKEQQVKDSCGIVSEESSIHYAIYTEDYCIDILSVREPEIIELPNT